MTPNTDLFRVKLGLLVGTGLICMTYLLQHYAERRQRLAVLKVAAAEERAVKRDRAQSRRDKDELRRLNHPVVNLLEDRFQASPFRFRWGAAEEAALREIAQSPEAAREGASEALWKAVGDGKTEAAGALWFLERDPKVVEALGAVFSDERRLAEDRAAAAFVLSLTLEPGAFRVLRREYRDAHRYGDEPYQVVLAKALYRERRELEFQKFLETVAAREEPPDADDPPPSQLARQALKELYLAR